MQIEFDAAKDRTNFAKHGVSLDEAARPDWAKVVKVLDTRRDMGRSAGAAIHLSTADCIASSLWSATAQ